MVFAQLALTLAILAPQGQEDLDTRITSVLSAAEKKKLNGLAKKWFEALKKWDEEANPTKRGKLSSRRNSARGKFMKEWSSKEKKEPIKHVGDLLAVFENVFPYPRQSGSGEVKPQVSKDGGSFDVVVPKGFKNEESHTTVIMVPPRDGERYVESKDHFVATWKGVDAAKNWLVVMPRVPVDIEFDPVPDLSTTTGDSVEMQRIGTMLTPVGRAQQMYRFDRNRLFLDCGRGASGFAMRLASYFPTRFAGLILRHPTEFGTTEGDDMGVREHFSYDTLAGVPVLLVRSEETAGACEQISAKMNELRAGACQVLDADDAELQTKIADWVGGVKRDLFRETVVLSPNHDRFRKGFWVQIDRCEPVHSGPEGRPYLKAEADRDANRISVTARNVSSFQLLLNDAIVDLDKEFSVVVNGKVITERLQRSFHRMTEFLSFTLFDPNRVWTATYSTTVPEEDTGDKGGE